MKKSISINGALSLIRNSGGKFFTVGFIKRTDNSYRIMNCRTGVSKNTKGIKHHRTLNGLITVYDMSVKNYRTINVSGMRDLWINKEYHKVIA